VLASDIEFPELAVAAQDGEPSWVLQSHAPTPSDEEHGQLLGTDVVTPNANVTLYRCGEGFRLVFDDTGCFEITGDARHIRWHVPEDARLADVRADVTGRVLAAALHLTGTLSLHASAVVIEGVAIGLVAPKHHGKSTLALALVQSGAGLLTDDTLPVQPGSPPMARPGLHAARLWPDSAARVGIGEHEPVPDGHKRLFAALPDERVEHVPRPLDALYLLAPVKSLDDGAAVRRTRLSSIEGAMVMIGHAKLAPLLAGAAASELFQPAAALADAIPVYRLNVVRDLDRLTEVVEQIREWHQPEPAAAGFRESA